MALKKMKLACVVLAAVLLGWELNSAVAAASRSNRVCLSNTGQLKKKVTCSSSDTEIATGKVRTRAVAKLKLSNGATRISSSAVSAASMPGALVSGTETDLVSSVGSSLRSYTKAVTFPTTWTGKVRTVCGADEVATGAYITVFLDGAKLPVSGLPTSTWSFSGGMIWKSGLGKEVQVLALSFGIPGNNAVVKDETYSSIDGIYPAENITDIPAGLTVYLTQVCAPLMTLEPAG